MNMRPIQKIIDETLYDENVLNETLDEVKKWAYNNLAPLIQKWIIEKFAPEVQNWVVNEFSPEIEKWVKDYMNDKRTQLHIKDFCINDNDKCGQCTMTEEIEEPVRKMGTIEPRYNDEKVSIDEDEYLCDDALAFIYGAIKKYGTSKACLDELKEYILKEATYIGKRNAE